MKIMVTGSAGFIGMHVCQCLLARGDEVVGVDNLNDYYEVSLKQARLAALLQSPNYSHQPVNIADRAGVEQLFAQTAPQRVIHLAAQAGVRYSLTNPYAYIDSNLIGFANILEGCRHGKVDHLVFASSSSVYGGNTGLPFSEHDNVDHPVSLYAATKKANELMAHSYSHLYALPTTGLRFFTVYGPWGRPDMSPMLFAKAILEGRAIDVFNFGKMQRDFTYIDDIVEGVLRVADALPVAQPEFDRSAPDPASSWAPYRIFNIGNHQPVDLLVFIAALEQALGTTAKKNFLPMQAGDVPATHADTSELERVTGFSPATSIETGVARFVAWYRQYYGQ